MFYIGDQKPIVIGSVVSSTGAAITSATCSSIMLAARSLVRCKLRELNWGSFKCANCNWIKRYEDLECFKDTWTVQA